MGTTRRPNFSFDLIGVQEGDELYFKKATEIRGFAKGNYSVIVDGIEFDGTNYAANFAFKKINERERTNNSNGWHGPRNWIHVKFGKSLFELYEENA